MNSLYLIQLQSDFLIFVFLYVDFVTERETGCQYIYIYISGPQGSFSQNFSSIGSAVSEKGDGSVGFFSLKPSQDQKEASHKTEKSIGESVPNKNRFSYLRSFVTFALL